MKKAFKKLGITIMAISVPAVSFATESTGMPWEEPLQVIIDSLTGPFLRVACILAIVISGLSLSFGENNGGFIRTCIRVIFGLAIACSASSWGLDLFGFSGGLLF
jgi:type IV secretion system protein TrbC